jgi:hypothetical protein
MKTLIYSVVIIFFVQFQGIAQNTTQYNTIQLASFNDGSAVLGADSQKLTSINVRTSRSLEGSPFYNDDWLPGIVLINNNLKSNRVQLRYDPYRNLVFFKEGDQFMALNNKFVTGFIIDKDNKKKFFKNGFESDKNEISPYTFLRVLHDGKTKLVVHHRTYIRKSHTNAFASGTVSDEFRHKEDYYLQTSKTENLKEIRLKKKDLFKHIDKKYHDRLESYAEKNDLDFGEEKGMSNILGYYEQLLTKK